MRHHAQTEREVDAINRLFRVSCLSHGSLQKKAHTFILQILISEHGIFRKGKKKREEKKAV